MMTKDKIPELGLAVAGLALAFIATVVMTGPAQASERDLAVVLAIKEQATASFSGTPADVAIAVEAVQTDLLESLLEAPQGCHTLIAYDYAVMTLATEAWSILEDAPETGLRIIDLAGSLFDSNVYQTAANDCLLAI